jgi:membrane dipeptidase
LVQPLDLAAEARRLHADALVIDACAPILRDHQYARYWVAGGATCALATVALHDDTMASTMATIGAFFRRSQAHPETLIARSVADIERARAVGKLAIVLMFQSTAALDRNVDLVEVYYRLGVRSMNLAYNQAEAAADGCMEPRDGGLTIFGRRVVAEINRVGVLLDLSHTGYRASMEAMALSTAPVAFTHSNPRAVFDHPRNLRDDQIDACVATGGVIGLNGHPLFVKAGTVSPSIDDLLLHLDYLVERAGIDHVGLGLDFSQPPGEQMSMLRYHRMHEEGVWPPGTLPPPPWYYPVQDASYLGQLTEAVLRRGWSESDVRKVLGENFLRLFRSVWKDEAAPA